MSHARQRVAICGNKSVGEIGTAIVWFTVPLQLLLSGIKMSAPAEQAPIPRSPKNIRQNQPRARATTTWFQIIPSSIVVRTPPLSFGPLSCACFNNMLHVSRHFFLKFHRTSRNNFFHASLNVLILPPASLPSVPCVSLQTIMIADVSPTLSSTGTAALWVGFACMTLSALVFAYYCYTASSSRSKSAFGVLDCLFPTFFSHSSFLLLFVIIHFHHHHQCISSIASVFGMQHLFFSFF